MTSGFDALLSAVGSEDRKDELRRKPQFPLIDIDEILKEPTPEWLIEDILIEGQLGILYGIPGVGKSFLALDWFLTITHAKRLWLDRFQVKRGHAIYIAGEGYKGQKLRLEAWRNTYGEQKYRGLLNPAAVNMLSYDDVVRFCTQIKLMLNEEPVRLVVVDTMARCMYTGNENAPQDVGMFVENCAEIIRQLNTTVLVIHHPDKHKGYERGHTALRGGADMMALLVEMPEGLVLHCVKQKDAIQFPNIHLRFQPTVPSAIIMPPKLIQNYYERTEEE